MNTTVNNLTIEQMRAIVEGAPAWPVIGYCTIGNNYIFKQCEHAPCSYSNSDNAWSEEYAISFVSLDDLRTAIDEHDSRAFKIGDHIRYMGIDRKTPHPEIFKVVGFDSMPGGGDGYKIKNCLGQIDFCYGDNFVLVDCDTTDHVTDIRNHVSPNCKVMERNNESCGGESWMI